MKLKPNHRPKTLALALLLAAGFSAVAQSNTVPGNTDYSAFVTFISQRNIFDPNRYPHEVRSTYHSRPTRHAANSAPVFTLVGTMNYEKGRFAFFNGNGSDFKKILETNGVIAGYTVTEISAGRVKLKGPDTNAVTMTLGDQMRQENNGWQFFAQGDAAGGQGSGGTVSAGSPGSPAATSAAPAPSANVSNNDVLKRLMELRQKANQ